MLVKNLKKAESELEEERVWRHGGYRQSDRSVVWLNSMGQLLMSTWEIKKGGDTTAMRSGVPTIHAQP